MCAKRVCVDVCVDKRALIGGVRCRRGCVRPGQFGRWHTA